MIDHGLRPLSLHYRERLTPRKHEIKEMIKSKRFSQIWISYQRRKTCEVTSNRLKKFLSVTHEWIHEAITAKTQVFILSVTGDHVMQNPYGQLAEEEILKVSKHRLCHFGYKVDPNQAEPSNVCFRIYSTEDIPSHPCRCNLPFQDHRSDWKTSGTLENAQPKSRVTTLVCKHVLRVLGFSEERLPDSSEKKESDTASVKKPSRKRVNFSETRENANPECAYPTEQREEWKRKQKANKEAGLEVQKRRKIVEDHFEDWGRRQWSWTSRY